jgi:hypothetical protein
MELTAFDKLIITRMNERINAHVIGIRSEPDGSETYMIQPLRLDFTPHKTGSKLMRINSKEIENKIVTIEKHEI